jgi:ribosomal protein S18 acetylase RimI-like enzyme
MLNLKKADMDDLEFLISIDLKNEGYSTAVMTEMTSKEKEVHKNKISSFITEKDKGVFIYEDCNQNTRVAMIMYSIINIDSQLPEYSILNKLDRSIFPENGRLIEVFQMWVKKKYRNQGLATKLKVKLEDVAKSLGIQLIYTHTEENNDIVIHLNKKLGYKEIRRGPIWDEIVRVSLIKNLL